MSTSKFAFYDMVLMYVSVSSMDKAEEIARIVMHERFSNHVNIMTGNKSYIWKDQKIVSSEETVLLIKTKALLYADIERRISSIFSDEVPKIFSVPITQIDFRYHDFLKNDVIKV